jgi:Pro-kumamolisin, activation domain
MPRFRWTVWFVGVAMILCMALPLLPQNGAFARQMGETRLVAVGALPPLVARSRVIGRANAQQMLEMSVNLRLRNVGALQQYLTGVYTPGSVIYHRYLSPQEFAALYGPTGQEIQQVSAYLRAEGFRVTHAAVRQGVIDFSGSVNQAERAFRVRINTYRTLDGRVFYANDASPKVPLALQPLIERVTGLSDAVQYQHPALKTGTVHATASPRAVSCPGPGSSAAHYYTPSQFATAYDFSGFYNAGYHGEGQSVALFELDSYTPGDISAYQSCFDSGSRTRIRTALVDGGPQSQGTGGLEVEIDMQVLLGMLPGLSNLVVYEAPNTDSAYNDEWAQILSDDLPIVSTSWGICEPDLSAADVNAEEQFFMQAAAQGQSLLAGSGDYGAYDCGDGSLAVDDPASNPYMTGVGGTHLALNSNNSYGSESGWSNSPASNYGSGGGISQLWTMPSYQSGTGVISSSSSGSPCHALNGHYCREVPDVSIDADPATGYVVYCTIAAAGCQSSAPFVYTGGSSVLAPMWAAVIALANQYALAHGGNNLGFLNPVLYGMLNNNSSYSQAFHDVTSGSNLYYGATTGYDLVTGMGTPDAYGFARALPLAGTRSVPASTRWYFAEGHLGNHFQEYLTLENPSASSAAHVTINYLLGGKPQVSQSITVNAGTRTTVNVNTALGVNYSSSTGLDVSLYITSDVPVVAERPIYFTFGGTTPGGSDLIGSTQLGQHFVFANAETLSGFGTFLTILNPPGQAPANVTASYYIGGVKVGRSVLTVPAGQRSTISVNHDLGTGKQCWVQVDASQPVVVERPLYFHIAVPGITGTVSGGSSVPGVLPAGDWYFPDGSTGASGTPSKENLILVNPDMNNTGSAATVTITYALANGSTKTVNLSLPAKGQVIENVNQDVGSSSLVAAQVHVSNGVGIVAERQQFFSMPTLVPTPTGTEVIGTMPGQSGLPTTYSFAEGHLGSSFSEFVTLFNPNNATINVSVTYFITNGAGHAIAQQQVSIPALGVVRINGNTFLNVASSDTTASGVATDTSLVVQSMPIGNNAPLPVVAERSLYFNFTGTMPGETSVVGYQDQVGYGAPSR